MTKNVTKITRFDIDMLIANGDDVTICHFYDMIVVHHLESRFTPMAVQAVHDYMDLRQI